MPTKFQSLLDSCVAHSLSNIIQDVANKKYKIGLDLLPVIQHHFRQACHEKDIIDFIERGTEKGTWLETEENREVRLKVDLHYLHPEELLNFSSEMLSERQCMLVT